MDPIEGLDRAIEDVAGSQATLSLGKGDIHMSGATAMGGRHKHHWTNLVNLAKVCQLDAFMLDNALMGMLHTQVRLVLQRFLPKDYSMYYARYKAETELGLKTLVWGLTMRVNRATPGQGLQNLRYRNEYLYNKFPHTKHLLKVPFDGPTKAQRVLSLLLGVFLPYLFLRLRVYALDNHWRSEEQSKFWALETSEKMWQVLKLANTVAFLAYGRYHCLTDRVLQMRLVSDRNEVLRQVSFEYLNQELLYEGATSTLAAVLPIVSSLNYMVTSSPLVKKVFTTVKKKLVGEPKEEDLKEIKEASFKCEICSEDPGVTPVQAHPCAHRFCYFCLKGANVVDCPVCECMIEGLERV